MEEGPVVGDGMLREDRVGQVVAKYVYLSIFVLDMECVGFHRVSSAGVNRTAMYGSPGNSTLKAPLKVPSSSAVLALSARGITRLLVDRGDQVATATSRQPQPAKS
jgi:hypothetical protein